MKHPASLDGWKAELADLGFRRVRGGDGYRLDGLVLTADDAWLTVQSAHPLAEGDPLTDGFGRPGLWKLVPAAGGLVRVCDVPLQALRLAAEARDADEEVSPLREAVAWALCSARGEVPDGWQPPPREEVEAFIPINGLTVQSGPFVRQGSLVHGDGRLALRFPVITRVPPELSDNRRAWLHATLLDAHARRLVRVGRAGEAVEVEVDLSGAPPALLEGLVGTGLAALRWAVEWLVWSAAFLADGGVRCQALEDCPVRA